MYSQAAAGPVYGAATAENPRQSLTLPVGTVALLEAANTCHLGLPGTMVLLVVGQAMKPFL